MLHGSSSPGVTGSELFRLLARLAGASPPDTRPPFAERLGHWLKWTDAAALSAALGTPPAAASMARPARGTGTLAADVQQVQRTLEATIAAGPREPGASPTDFGPHRRHCAACQQAMQDAVGALRQRLRDALACRSPQGARLAAIDAAMDQALAAHERHLLGLVPWRLQAHFDHLQRCAADDPRWPESFRADRDRVLRAELAHRLLPCRGLLDALPTDPTT